MNYAIPDDVRCFVLTCITSIPLMEAALLFYEAPETEWTVLQIASALYSAEGSTLAILRNLEAIGLIKEGENRFMYAPRDHALAGIFAKTAQAYRSDLIGMTRLIHDQTQRNALRFAEAFRMRRDT